MLSCPFVPLCGPGVSLFWQPLAAVATTSPCKGVGSVLAWGVKSGEQLPAGEGKEGSVLERGAKSGFCWGKKNLSAYVFHSEHGIFRRKFEYQNIRAKIWSFSFWQLRTGLGCSVFDSKATYIRTIFFSFFFYRMLTFSGSFSFKCCFTEHFQERFSWYLILRASHCESNSQDARKGLWECISSADSWEWLQAVLGALCTLPLQDSRKVE